MVCPIKKQRGALRHHLSEDGIGAIDHVGFAMRGRFQLDPRLQVIVPCLDAGCDGLWVSRQPGLRKDVGPVEQGGWPRIHREPYLFAIRSNAKIPFPAEVL